MAKTYDDLLSEYNIQVNEKNDYKSNITIEPNDIGANDIAPTSDQNSQSVGTGELTETRNTDDNVVDSAVDIDNDVTEERDVPWTGIILSSIGVILLILIVVLLATGTIQKYALKLAKNDLVPDWLKKVLTTISVWPSLSKRKLSTFLYNESNNEIDVNWLYDYLASERVIEIEDGLFFDKTKRTVVDFDFYDGYIILRFTGDSRDFFIDRIENGILRGSYDLCNFYSVTAPDKLSVLEAYGKDS